LLEKLQQRHKDPLPILPPTSWMSRKNEFCETKPKSAVFS
jgi:hypothetical protein